MNKDSLRQLANIVTVILALTVNTLAALLPLNGQDTGEISDRLPTYFTPAGYVFSIWSLIFIGWIIFAIYQALPAQRENPRLRNLGYLFALSNIFNAAWLFCWHYNYFGLSVLVMLILLGLLIASYLAIHAGRTSVTAIEKLAVDAMFSVYLGWISVATIANIATWLVSIQWDGFGIAPQVWAAIMIAVASLLGILMMFRRRDSGYVFVLAWAFAGIAVKQAGEPLVSNAASVATAVAVGLAVYGILQRRRISRTGQITKK
jgi:hypothetical protein